ncbi:phosphoglycerate kinase [Buchnera aphidicola (Ceratoglyphina bambusae)]|uniref:phosphoglycerate kinase n=1 Tax=Buchnera aphidicola TaxID=9 RepID=UPI0031B8A6B3
MKNIKNVNIYKKNIIIRSDLNVPIIKNKIISSERIDRSINTIKYALKKKSKIILMSHLGRPTEGKFEEKYSLFPIFLYLKKKLHNVKITFHKNISEPIKIKYGEIALLENVRFNIGESSNSKILSKKYAKLCEIFVMDAFGSAHRLQSSTAGIIKFVKKTCIGILLESEILSINKVLKNPKRPLVSIIGGSKISTKFKLLKSLGKISDKIIVGGGIANTFIAIKNEVGKSLYEKKFVKEASKLLKQFNFFIPTDSRVGKEFSNNTVVKNRLVSNIKLNEEIMDIGKNSEKEIKKIIKKANTIIWNGPLGVFEFSKFSNGTKTVAKSISENNSFSIAGGGETLAIINLLKLNKNISYISTGGGAFLEFLINGTLPVIELIKKNKKQIKKVQ